MADEEQTAGAEEAGSRKGPGLLVWAALGVAAAGIGFAVPFFLPAAKDGKSAEAGAAERGLHPRIPDQLAFVPFGDVTVNLDDGRLSRYLHLSFSLQIEKKDQLEVTKL
ncbi:MAG: flagellar basal body-associated protein FliL, partial [Planctomycetaceae bacterium]